MTQPIVLISHALCPFVQRVAIVLLEKHVPFKKRYIDLNKKPAWFSSISPLGTTPLLLIGENVLFESAVICEYLDEVYTPRLHPEPPLDRAWHRAWIEFGSSILGTITHFYSTTEPEVFEQKRHELLAKFAKIETLLSNTPYFSGSQFSLIDAVYAPIFRYFDGIDHIGDFGIFTHTPKLRAWRRALNTRLSVQQAVIPNFQEQLVRFLHSRQSIMLEHANHSVENGQ